MTSQWTVVLDDDPTGTQGLSEVPVVVRPRPETMDWAFEQARVVYILTNTRALDVDEARTIVAESVAASEAAAERAGGTVRFVSRGDSTLRGHFPVEVQTILRSSTAEVRGCILVPAFPDAGRITLEGVHYVRANGQLEPVGRTEYARDATFGFTDSRLSEWARKRIPADWAVVELPTAVFNEGEDALRRFLLEQKPFTVVCPSIRHEADLSLLAQAQRTAEDAGAVYVVQAGPAYPRHLAQLGDAIRAEPVVADNYGLVVVGSHTKTTTAQLDELRDAHPFTEVELNVTDLLGERSGVEIQRVIDAASEALSSELVVLATSREVVVGNDAASSLKIANTVASALTSVTAALLHAEPAFVIAKGGVTSRDVIADSLGWDAATVVGPLIDSTLPVWQSWDEPSRGPVAVIFPGNVGRADLLARAVTRLAQLGSNHQERTVAR